MSYNFSFYKFLEEKKEIEFIDEQAKKTGMNRTRFVVECVKFYVENHK